MDTYTNKHDSTKVINKHEVLDAARNGEKINLIKLYRMLSGAGLKESKDAVETVERYGDARSGYYDESGIDDLFSAICYDPSISKEELLQMISEALDAGEALFMDNQLQVLELFCSNIRHKGGLNVIAKERAKFLSSI